MLTPEQIDGFQVAAGRLVDPVTEYLLQDIARRVQEAGQLTSTAAYEAWRAEWLGKGRKDMEKELARLLGVSRKDARKLLRTAGRYGYDLTLSRRKGHMIPFAENEGLQQIISAACTLAGDELKNLTQTTAIGMVNAAGKLVPLAEAYRSCTDFAFQQVFTGATDYNTAIRQACAGIVKHGVQVTYESGVHTTIEAAVRRNIMGGLGLMVEQINQQNHDDLGCDGWEISVHANSAPDHEPFQGRQYSDEEYEKLNNSLVRRISTLNCGHVAFPIILGVDSPQYTQAELDKFREDNEKGVTYNGKHYTGYGATQMQRKIERSIRYQKRRSLLAAPEDKQNAQIKLQMYRQEYKRFSKGVGLRTEDERLHVSGFGKKEAREAVIASEQNYQKWSNEIGANPPIETLAKYYDVKYDDSPRYALLKGYARAVEKHDISPLVGFERYEQVSADIQSRIVGTTTATGVQIESFTTHFVDRVIGQTSTSHPGMRCGVSIEDAKDALINPEKFGAVCHLDDGDIRQTMYGKNAVVALSIRDKRLIQTNPRNG